MTAAPLLAAAAVLLAFAALRELVEGRERPEEPPRLLRILRGRPAGAGPRLPERLAGSGLRSRISLSAKIAFVAVAAMFAAIAAPAAPGRVSILVAAGLPIAGFMAPDALLEREARRRRRRLVGALPDALDLLAVGATAGRSTAVGFEEIAGGGDGPLAEELRIAVAELACGRPMPAVLAALRSRVPGGEISTLAASIERSRLLGSPLAEQLRRQASALRRDQRRLVEERAARAAPKIQLVVALVLVPSVLLMIAAGLIANAGSLLSGF